MTIDDFLIRVLKIIPILGLVGLLIQTSSFFVSQCQQPETSAKGTAKAEEAGHVR